MQNYIFEVVNILKNGQTILYPTDTIWGLGCDATNEKAVEKIYEIKNRPKNKSCIILVNSLEMLANYVVNFDKKMNDYIDNLDKNIPTTIIFSEGKNLPKNALNENGSVAIRIVNHTFCNYLIAAFNKPIISTSANISGENNPINFDAINTSILENVDYIIDKKFDTSIYTKPSKLIQFIDEQIVILRD